MELEDACERFVDWLLRRVVVAARGDNLYEMEQAPFGKFWLGRLAPEATVLSKGWGDRGERLDPCAVGLRFRAIGDAPWSFSVTVRFRAWHKDGKAWKKTDAIVETFAVEVKPSDRGKSVGSDVLAAKLQALLGNPGLSAELRLSAERNPLGDPEISVLLVNTSQDDDETKADTNLYECALEVIGAPSTPYLLEALPDSFRYDRRQTAYGINCGVEVNGEGVLRTDDVPTANKKRPKFWSQPTPAPDLSFATLGNDPLPQLKTLLTALSSWGEKAWSEAGLRDRAAREGWDGAMLEEARKESRKFEAELRRLESGLALLRSNLDLQRAFRLMNAAMLDSALKHRKYDAWRPFQVGFLLANLNSIANPSDEATIADIVWFATGGGKTETYLGLIVTAAIHDRLTGKTSGITAWSRFPLRMLSLQQTQRFADAIASAEIVRRRESIHGDSFSVGFFVGQGATPNRINPNPDEIRPDEFNIEDDDAPKRYQVLLYCPFCRGNTIEMGFNRVLFRLEHRCTNEECPWPNEGLPFYIVDDEIYRYLPTVVVGTLDKAASIAFQASMRGFVGAPMGICSEPEHGYTYAIRSKQPKGCLVPGCNRTVLPLQGDPTRFAPSYRLQDELHLLKDSLGAVDSHYEALYDSLELALSGRLPKILASSATLTGYDKQVSVLYNRDARVFPLAGPSAGTGFWVEDSEHLMRRYAALAPRGVTHEYAVDRILTELQCAIRLLQDQPEQVLRETGIDKRHLGSIVSLYGTNVVYGNTLRDLDAVERSVETQLQVEGKVNTASLTGRDEFSDVRSTLERLEKPEDEFSERIHVTVASSMMSHGVDIDRLNIMVMLGLPLSSAEFIQATARVGRRYPGLVFAIHKIGRERDAGIYRSFAKFIEHGDRFVEPIPVTRRSRRVLERTLPGMELARINMIMESNAGGPLTTIQRLRDYLKRASIDLSSEATAVATALGFTQAQDDTLRSDINAWFAAFEANLRDPGGTARWPSELSPTRGPMRSLRDVEEQAPIVGSSTNR